MALRGVLLERSRNRGFRAGGCEPSGDDGPFDGEHEQLRMHRGAESSVLASETYHALASASMAAKRYAGIRTVLRLSASLRLRLHGDTLRQAFAFYLTVEARPTPNLSGLAQCSLDDQPETLFQHLADAAPALRLGVV